MRMDIRIDSVDANSQASNIRLYNDNTKMPKLQDTQLGISKIHVFCQKTQQGD